MAPLTPSTHPPPSSAPTNQSTDIDAAAAHTTLLHTLDINSLHKPFRNPAWKPPQRRNKTVKQILADAQRREQQAANAAANAAAAAAEAAKNGVNENGSIDGGAEVIMDGTETAGNGSTAAGTPVVGTTAVGTQVNSGVSTPSGTVAGGMRRGGGDESLAAATAQRLSKLAIERSASYSVGNANSNNDTNNTDSPALNRQDSSSSVPVQSQRQQKASLSSGPIATYTNIESAPSMHPSSRRHYCDVTGLPAPYTDPKTRLRYHNAEVFGLVRAMGTQTADAYLGARGANVILK